ncbi:hypothetical protein [Micromonospora thermarum]|uniref:Uncharacterized protein n=1 Tax=Micromonospora thermarum TaxID=2720024 RepID=A0ABX0Z600_9ACTN|nr:hypothetical protein [Micromonospora thermarum]NJP33266.1 hypothetical protein [Micromonospora thermarum]
MDEDLRPRAVWPEVVGVAAADEFPLAVFALFTEVLARGPMGPGVYAPAVLAAAIAVPALLPLLPRLLGWLVAAGTELFVAASPPSGTTVPSVEPGVIRPGSGSPSGWSWSPLSSRTSGGAGKAWSARPGSVPERPWR